ncbi:DUF559 domain-containing protein [Candidatus Gracilibacteria bacterium 28_42_T64]|nr:DUF559 domain-containing protein [Candidatus Gracilibacteria bacterium 28_42_T64]
MKKVSEVIIGVSRRLRKEMTGSEKILWEKLKSKQLKNIKFLRQAPVYVYTENSGLDRYIISDFLCREYNLIIELDGSVHDLKEIYELDKHKESLLTNLGYKIIRFKNEEIHSNLEKVLSKIVASFSGQGERIQERGLKNRS